MSEQTLLSVEEASQIGEARRVALALGAEAGLTDEAKGRLALVVTEVCTNMVRHGKQGELLLRTLIGVAGVEVLAVDRGPGMVDVARSMVDGFSTGGTPGLGLSAMRRQAEDFDVWSQPDQGTAVLLRVFDRPVPKRPTPGLQVGAVSVPITGELENGDAYYVERLSPVRAVVAVVDGLGHGALAAAPARAAVELLRTRPVAPPEELLAQMHEALRGTRGAAAGVAVVRFSECELEYAGVGNIAAAIHAPGERSRALMTHNGTLGVEARRIQSLTYPFPRGATLIASSDGLASSLGLDRYPGLLGRDPALVAGVLYRDFARRRDDATVVVVREAI